LLDEGAALLAADARVTVIATAVLTGVVEVLEGRDVLGAVVERLCLVETC
jgi:hypothetical protein